MGAIDWTKVEDAFFDWVVAGTGLAEDKVIWSHQGSPRPDAPYVSLMISSVQRAGRDWIDTYDNPSPVPGQEIIRKARGPRFCALSIQCFTYYDMISQQGPMQILTDLIASLPLHRYALHRAGIGISDFGSIGTVGGMLNSQLESRAHVDLEFHLASEVQGFDTYIEKIIATNENTNETFEVSRPGLAYGTTSGSRQVSAASGGAVIAGAAVTTATAQVSAATGTVT
jgi:hypothetical protein